ncbi:MAG: AAA family ATPase [Candidatus Zixiibacteriota bacterium]
MYIESIEIENFRNIKSERLDFSPKVNILLGPNAGGKTNILEAIHCLCLGKSQRGAKTQTQISFGSNYARLVGSGYFQKKKLPLNTVLM